MTDEHVHVEDLIAAYVLGAVTEEEAALVERHLSTCASCQLLSNELGEVESMLPDLAGELTPPATLKERLMAAVEAEPRRGPVAGPAVQPAEPTRAPVRPDNRRAGIGNIVRGPWTGRRLAYQVLAVAAALVLVAGAATLWRTLNTAKPQVYNIAGQAVPAISGRLTYYSDEKRATLSLSGLHPLPAGRVYEMWLIRTQGTQQVQGVLVFRPRNGTATETLNGYDVSRYNQVAFTVERAPGSSTPHPPIIAKGSI